MVLAYDLLEDKRTIDVIGTKFSIPVLKWRKDLRLKTIFYVTGQKIRYKKSLAEALNRFEKQKTKDKAVSFRK